MSLTSTLLTEVAEPSVALDEFVAAVIPASRLTRSETTVRIRPRHASAEATVTLRYLRQGAIGAPLVIVQGGISANRDVCDGAERSGWWRDLVGPGCPVDLTRYQVLSIDWLAAADLGECRAVAAEDQADALAALLDALAITQVQAFVGASYGAMVGLNFAQRHPGRVQRLIAISGAHRAHPLATAVRAIQREIVRDGIRRGDVGSALALARQLAMTTYRGAEEFAERFDAQPQWRDGRFHFPVEDYLQAAGAKFVARFDAQRYLSLSESIDLHCVDASQIRVPTDVIAISSDRLVPAADLRELADTIAAPSTYHEIDSRYGHDAFLKEPERIGALVSHALSCC